MTTYKTLEPDNKFTFTCPIFDAQTKMADCVKLRNKVWRGETPKVRRGCQACMRAGKCPAAHFVQAVAMTGAIRPSVSDDYASDEPVKGKLRKDLLERVANVMVPDSLKISFGLSQAESDMIDTSGARIRKQLGMAPMPSGNAPEPRSSGTVRSKPGAPKRTRKAAAKPKSDDTINQAAASGDMSAAVSKKDD